MAQIAVIHPEHENSRISNGVRPGQMLLVGSSFALTLFAFEAG
jgi:hypothetical protein